MDALAARLARLVAHPTVAAPDPAATDPTPFEALHRTLAELYPLLHQRCELTRVGPHGLLFRWPGSDPDADALVLMAHQDVVPVTGQGWSGDPFEARVVDGKLIGRGVLDDKGMLLVVAEAVEALLAAFGLLVPFVRHSLRVEEPLVDVRMLAAPAQWPVQLTATLFGVSVLVVAAAFVAVGYLLFLPFHDTLVQTLTNMVVAGLGSGLLVAELPSAAAAAAPEARSGMATGLTNATKTVGGSIASAVFGVALFQGMSAAAVEAGQTAAPLSGYLVVWTLCGVTAAICALVLLVGVPKDAFTRPAHA